MKEFLAAKEQTSVLITSFYLFLFVVLLQLRYNGLLETIRIRRDGFSWRPSFEEFAERFVKTSECSLLDIVREATLVTRCGQRVKLPLQSSHAWDHGVVCCEMLSGKDSDLLLFCCEGDMDHFSTSRMGLLPSWIGLFFTDMEFF